MSVKEIYTAIRKSNDANCYTIIYCINNNMIQEAVALIQNSFNCNEKISIEAARMIKMDLDKAKPKNNL